MSEHYFTKNPTSELKLKKHNNIIRGFPITFYSGSGVFGKTKVDFGSKLLIEKSEIKSNSKILDLGCGYGIVGIALLNSLPHLEVTFSDINKRAIKLTRMNFKLNKVKGKTIHSDGFEKINETFDTILLNPPQTAGKKVCQMLIKDSKDHLNKDGTLQIVARHNKGGKTLSLYMEEVFGNVKDITKAKGYRIYLSQK